MNINYTLKKSTNSDINFIDFNKLLNYMIYEKENDLDKKTKQYVDNIIKKYNLGKLLKFNKDELKQMKYQTEEDFYKNHKNIQEKIYKLKLIHKILNIDLNYYENQIKNINKIIKNQNFKEEIENINEKIRNNEKVSKEEMKKISFYDQLLKQKSYIQDIILSEQNKLYSKNKTIIKNKIVEEMKTIEDETKIYLKDQIKETIDYNQIMDSWNESQLKKLIKQVDMKVEDNKLMNLKYQLIDCLQKLTNKSHKEINLILKDPLFKEKIFEDINIQDINSKINQLNDEIVQYNKIDKYLESIKKELHVCPICNYSNKIPIHSILHLTEHKNEDNLKVQRFYFYKDENQNIKSKYSENIIKDQNVYLYETKKKMLKSDTIKNQTLVTSKIPIQNEINIQKIENKLSKEEILKDYKDGVMLYYKNYIKIFPKIADIIEKRVNNEIENRVYDDLFGDDKTSSYLNKIIHYDVSRLVLNNYFNHDDIYNLYNTNITYFDENLKKNDSFDILFKNIIHYNTFEPMENISNMMNSFMNIIQNKNDLEKMLFADSSSKSYRKFDKKNQAVVQPRVAEVEVSEHLDYKTLMLLIPILRDRNLTLYIQDFIKSDDFEINEDEESLFKPWKWVQKSDYKKMITRISNIKRDDINIKEIENDKDNYIRLHELFENISNIKNIKKEFELITEIFNSFLRSNRVAHDINNIDNDKDINGKFKEYIIGSYLKSSLNILNKIVVNNDNNESNTKKEIRTMFNTLSIFLNKDSFYLQKNVRNYQKNQKRNIINNKNDEKDNKDDILNEYFESDNEYELDIEDNFEQEDDIGDDYLFDDDSDQEMDFDDLDDEEEYGAEF